jgi:chorismate dehydratase
MRPRVGHIQFLNCLPLYHSLVGNGSTQDMDLIKGTPTELNLKLLQGKLDVGPISSIEYARNCEKFLLLPQLTVSSESDVKSILLVSKIAPEKLNGKQVALTNMSATSQALVQIILKEAYNVNPVFFSSPSNLHEMLKKADAALLIGDDALTALVYPNGYKVFDLGMEWRRLTGKKMVYAVWVAQRELAEQDPYLVQEVWRALHYSKDHSMDIVDRVAEEASQTRSFSAEFLRDYFLNLRFDFGQDYQDGLRCFCEKATKYGFLHKMPCFDFVEV